MSAPWRRVALFLAITALYIAAVPATHSGTSLVHARAQILGGELPLWDGAPLLANPYLGLPHPFTLVAVLAGTAVVATALRIFAMLLFAFLLFRSWNTGMFSAIFGAIAFALCTTHLLSWRALTMTTLPLALLAAQEHARRPRAATFAVMTAALSCAFLGGDFTGAVRICLVTAAYLVFFTRNLRALLTAAIAIALAVGLTAFYWMPLQDIAPHIAPHITNGEISHDWLPSLSLIAPNVLGATGTGYAGILTLVLAALGLLLSYRRERWFFAFVALAVFWPLGLPALAALGLCAVARGDVPPRTLQIVSGCAAFVLLTVWFARAEYVSESFAWTQALIPFLALGLFTVAASVRRFFPAVVAAMLTLAELTLVAQQARPQVPRLENDRAARIATEAPAAMAAFARTPPAFAVQHYVVQAEVPDVIPRLQRMTDLRHDAVVHDIPPSIVEQAPQLAHANVSTPREVRVKASSTRERQLDVAAGSGWSVIVTHDVDWPGWRAYWNGHRQPVVTVNGAFAGAFVPPEKGTLELRYWPAVFLDGVRVSGAALVLFAIAAVVLSRASLRAKGEG
jgi:hypothetical protein